MVILSFIKYISEFPYPLILLSLSVYNPDNKSGNMYSVTKHLEWNLTTIIPEF